MARSRDRRTTIQLQLPARRAACRSLRPSALEAVLGEPERLYVAWRDDDGRGVIDVIEDLGGPVGRLAVQWPDWGGRGDGTFTLAAVLLQDATGRPPGLATANAFAEDVLEHLPHDGFAISAGEVCAWLLMRALTRTT
jgi:hypothetical protein